jgi:hypothetical protein
MKFEQQQYTSLNKTRRWWSLNLRQKYMLLDAYTFINGFFLGVLLGRILEG